MGINYSIDAAARIVRMDFSGEITLQDLTTAMDGVFASPVYQPGFGLLVDRRSAVPPTAEYIEQAVAFALLNQKRLAGARWAVVVTVGKQLEAAHSGERLAERAAIATSIELFEDIEAAEIWLRLTAPQG